MQMLSKFSHNHHSSGVKLLTKYIRRGFLVLISGCLFIFLSACENHFETNQFEISTTHISATPMVKIEPSNTPSPTVALASTLQYYTDGELQANDKYWTAENFIVVGYNPAATSAECVPLPSKSWSQQPTAKLHLPSPNGELVFNHKVFTRSSPNVWVHSEPFYILIQNTGVETPMRLEISDGMISVQTEIYIQSILVDTCTNQYVLNDSYLSASPTHSATQPLPWVLDKQYNVYSKAEINAQKNIWVSDYYKYMDPFVFRTDYGTSYAVCRYLAEFSDEFSVYNELVLPKYGDNMLWGNFEFSRVSSDYWVANPVSTSGLEYSISLRISPSLLIETYQFTTSSGDTVVCENLFIPEVSN